MSRGVPTDQVAAPPTERATPSATTAPNERAPAPLDREAQYTAP